MLEVLLKNFFVVILMALFCSLANGIGQILLYRTSIRFSSLSERFFFCSGIGFGAIGYFVFVLASLKFLTPEALWSMLALSSLLSIAGWLKFTKPSVSFVSVPSINLVDKISILLLIVCFISGLILTLTPETGKDALIYHLAVPKLFLKQQGFYFIEGNVFAHYPLHSEMLYLLSLFIHGDVLAKCMHFSMLLIISLGMYALCLHRIRNVNFTFLGILIFCSIPSVFFVSHTTNNDLFVTFYSFASVFAMINWLNERSRGWLILCGLLTGFAVASKYTALLLPALGCLAVLLGARVQGLRASNALGLTSLYCLTVIATGISYYVKNFIMTGNPFYPFLYSIFGGIGWDADQARLYDLFVHNLGMGRAFLDYVLLPWNLSFRAKMDSPHFDGIIGPVFFLIIPFALGMQKTDIYVRVILIYFLFTFLFWASSAQQIRYLIPVFPLLSVLIAVIVTYYQKKRAVFALLLVFIIGSVFFHGYHISREFIKLSPIPVLIQAESREAYMQRILQSYGMFSFMNKNLRADSRVFLIYMKNWTYLCDVDCYSDSMFESYTIQKILSESSSPLQVSAILKEKGFTHILCDLDYIYGDLSTFSPHEKDVFQEFQHKHLQTLKAERSFRLYRIL